MASAKQIPYFLYVLECSNGSFYIGHTKNVPERVKAHNEGRGAAHTADHLPARLVYQEEHRSAEKAITRELQLKRWTHAKKRALISGDKAALKSLAKRVIR